MRYGSVCSGVEAATLAWRGLGWKAQFFSEIEPFPCAVLAAHFPETPNLGNLTEIGVKEDGTAFSTVCGIDANGQIDLIVGGTPCQSYSVAGKREGNRGVSGLSLDYIRLAFETRARWLVWENVPGVFTSTNGLDFQAFLSVLVKWDVPVPKRGWRNAGIVTNGQGGGMASPGECLTLNIREWTDFHAPSRNEEGACSSSDTVASLTDILWTGSVPRKFYLTGRACQGILQRAERRGKTLPQILREALELQMGDRGTRTERTQR